jgi:hypothetical protein
MPVINAMDAWGNGYVPEFQQLMQQKNEPNPAEAHS